MSEISSLGAFSISLAVADLAESTDFYNKLGFSTKGGDPAQNWIVLSNGDAVIGLFQGMFERNIITFNPGWDQKAQPLDEFRDVREIEADLASAGIELAAATDKSVAEGPGYIVLHDPDGNEILIDQHR
jgi:lactoylglutathione lyase